MKLPGKILVATNNSGKFVEISDLLKQINIKAIKPPAELAEPKETGKTFAANSLLKAKYYAQKTGLVALADDSGLCIEALNGKPGIHSARFSLDQFGKKNFPNAFKKIAAELKNNGVNPSGSKAHFICNLTIFDPKTNFAKSFEGRIDGSLTFPPLGNKGFGYDPIFVKDGMTKTFGEISAAKKDTISHRAQAFTQLIKYFSDPQRLIHVDVVAKSKKWLSIKNIEKFIEKTCKELILLSEIKSFLKKQNSLDLSVSLVSDAQIKKINHEFRNKNKATDVLSFSFLDEKLIRKNGFENVVKSMPQLFLGDIVLAFETINKEAIAAKKDFYHHLTHLLLHSILHLIGYDHENKEDAKIMEKIETKILQKIGIKNPYL